MSIKSVIRTYILIDDYYDIAENIKEEQVHRDLFDYNDCSTKILLAGIFYRNKSCSVINKDTGEEICFDNEKDFESWKTSVSLSDLVNCVIEIQRE